MQIGNIFKCNYCGEVLADDEMEVPFQVGHKHYCSESHALADRYKEDDEVEKQTTSIND